MKKLFLLMALACISIAANAQAYVGGTLGIAVAHASTNGASATNSAFAINPEAGYFFNDTWAVGASVGVKYQSVSDTGITTFSVLPYVRANFAHVSIFDFFAELALGYSHESVEGDGVGGFTSGLRPGFAANFNDNFALIGRTTLLSYSHYDGVNGIGFAINSNFELGVQFKF